MASALKPHYHGWRSLRLRWRLHGEVRKLLQLRALALQRERVDRRKLRIRRRRQQRFLANAGGQQFHAYRSPMGHFAALRLRLHSKRKRRQDRISWRRSASTSIVANCSAIFLSPQAAARAARSGVTEAPPLANYVTGSGTRTLTNPLGNAVIPVTSSNPNTFTSKLPTANQIKAGCGGLAVEIAGGDCGTQPFNFGTYARDNKLPYSINFALNMQVQLDSSTVFTVGYTGNRGRHLVIPRPIQRAGHRELPAGLSTAKPVATAMKY